MGQRSGCDHWYGFWVVKCLRDVVLPLSSVTSAQRIRKHCWVERRHEHLLQRACTPTNGTHQHMPSATRDNPESVDRGQNLSVDDDADVGWTWKVPSRSPYACACIALFREQTRNNLRKDVVG